jgi:hypothetical protein
LLTEAKYEALQSPVQLLRTSLPKLSGKAEGVLDRVLLVADGGEMGLRYPLVVSGGSPN